LPIELWLNLLRALSFRARTRAYPSPSKDVDRAEKVKAGINISRIDLFARQKKKCWCRTEPNVRLASKVLTTWYFGVQRV